MKAISTKWRIALLAYGISLGLMKPARAQITPPPSLGEGGQEVHDGGVVKGDFVTMLTLVLSLTADQQTKVRAIFEDMRARTKVISDSTTLSQDDKKVKIKELRDTANTKIRSLLTPDQQKNFDEVLKQLSQGARKDK